MELCNRLPEAFMINLERRKKILELLEKEGQVSTIRLEERLGVTGATIRSDLRDLDRRVLSYVFTAGRRWPIRVVLTRRMRIICADR